MKRILFVILFLGKLAVQAQQYNSYAVKQGDTIEGIAKVFRVSPNDLIGLNPSLENGLKAGMVLIIPGSNVVHYSTKQPVGFKVHKVGERETLFGLAQKYGITQDDLRRYNNILYTKSLQKGQEITIPVYAQTDNTGVTKGREGLSLYVVKPREGKWRIAQNFGISQQELEKINPGLPQVLREGMEIWVPSRRISVAQEQRTLVMYQVEKGEGFMSLERKFKLSQEELVKLNPELKEGIKLEAQIWIPKENFMEYTATLGGVSESGVWDSNPYVREHMLPASVRSISFVLPFKTASVQAGNIADLKNKLQKDKLTSIATDFYAGAIIALDSLAQLGFSLDVNVFDSNASAQTVAGLASNPDLMNSQVVVGPFLPATFNKLSQILSSEVPVLAPLSNKNINLAPNVFQTVPTTEVQQDKMIDFMRQKYPDANTILLADAKSNDLNDKLLMYFPNAKVVDNIQQVGAAMDKEKTNIVFVSSNDVVYLSDVIRILYNTSKVGENQPAYNVIMATLDKGSAYDHNSISNTQLSALKLTFPSVNRYAGETNAFIRKYYDTYKTSPSKYAFRGFDITMDAVLRASLPQGFIPSTNSLSETSYLENKFRYIKSPFKGGGYENQGVYIVRYDDLEVKEIY